MDSGGWAGAMLRAADPRDLVSWAMGRPLMGTLEQEFLPSDTQLPLPLSAISPGQLKCLFPASSNPDCHPIL